MSAPSDSEALSIPEALARARSHWKAGQILLAEQLCLRVLAVQPEHGDALHLLGLMAHAHGNLDLAIHYVQQACAARGAPAVYSSNLAEMCRQRGRLADAEQAARRAIASDPTLVGGWNNLGVVLQEAGKFDESRECLERVIELRPDSAEARNNLANTCRRLGRLDLAESRYREALALNPGYAEAHSNLAFLLSSQGRHDDAADEARRAIELNPRLVDAYLNLADVELSRHHYEVARQTLERLRMFAPQHPAVLVAYAKTLIQLERNAEALDFAGQAVALAPQSAEAHQALARALQSLGRTDEALAAFANAAELPGAVAEDAMLGCATLLMEAGRKAESLAAFDRALEAFPRSAKIIAARADVRTFSAGDTDFATLEAFLAEGERHPLPDRISAHFALGKAYLDVKNPERAFAHFDAGNRSKRSTFAYDSNASSQWMRRVAEVFSPSLFETLQGVGHASDLPVFIVGMPRSGTTLIEQIVSSHPQVTGAGELSALRHIVDGSGNFPERMIGLSHDEAHAMFGQLGRDYLARVTPLAQGRSRLVDKMPGNFLFAGLIPLILPGARIIHARRDPVDTCLSCYTKLFSGDQRFAYEQTELGMFYRDYETLMAHWHEQLPADCLIEVDYESVVDDLEGEARRLIDFLGLPWDNACVNFYENRRVVRTASVNQVRQPIYTSSKGRWQPYASYLKPLLASLGIEAP